MHVYVDTYVWSIHCTGTCMWVHTVQVCMCLYTVQVCMYLTHVPVEAEVNLQCHSFGAIHFFVGGVLFLRQISPWPGAGPVGHTFPALG